MHRSGSSACWAPSRGRIDAALPPRRRRRWHREQSPRRARSGTPCGVRWRTAYWGTASGLRHGIRRVMPAGSCPPRRTAARPASFFQARVWAKPDAARGCCNPRVCAPWPAPRALGGRARAGPPGRAGSSAVVGDAGLEMGRGSLPRSARWACPVVICVLVDDSLALIRAEGSARTQRPNLGVDFRRTGAGHGFRGVWRAGFRRS